MSSSINAFWTESLPDPLPANPLVLAAEWLAQASLDASQPNPNSMVLATVDSRGHPSARVVLCKEIDSEPGFILFYTNYRSRKGRELGATEMYALAKMRLFAAFDEIEELRCERLNVLVDEGNIKELLAPLDL